MRISIQRLKDRIRVINSYTNNKYNIKLWETTGCGVDISINGVWQRDELNKKRNFTNKEAMELLDSRFNDEIRTIIMKQYGREN